MAKLIDWLSRVPHIRLAWVVASWAHAHIRGREL